jgi:SAM-dependent methyltransferase
MERLDGAPLDIDTDRPTAARIYDYLLGGSHNFAADRAVADQLIASIPEAPAMARANRDFLRRAVTYCVESGVKQFLDVGSGIPTLGNVHQVAQEIDPSSRVAYVDIDPIAVEHSRILLADNANAIAIQDDLRNPKLTANPQLGELFDFDQPVALLLVAVLHFVPEADHPQAVIARLSRRLAPGSLLVLSHGTEDGWAEDAERRYDLYERTATPAMSRTRAEVEALFAGFEMVEPGVVWAPEWHPDGMVESADRPSSTSVYVGVGRKPQPPDRA